MRQATAAMSPNPTLTPSAGRAQASPVLPKAAGGTGRDPAPTAHSGKPADPAPALTTKGEHAPPHGPGQPAASSSARRGSSSSYEVDEGWSWMIVLGAWLISFLLSGFTLSFTIVYQELKKRYGGSAAETAWVLATYGAVRMFSSPMVSALCKAYSHRDVALIGSVINSAAMAGSGYISSLNWLYLIFGIIGGFSSNMVYLPPFPVISYYFERRRGLAMALASTGSGIGGVVMAPLIELLFRTYGYSGGMLIIGGMMLNCCVASALLRPATKIPSFEKKVEAKISVQTRTEQKHPNQSAWYYGSVASFGSFMALDKIKDRPEKDAVVTKADASRKHLFPQLEANYKDFQYSHSDPCLEVSALTNNANKTCFATHIDSSPNESDNANKQQRSKGAEKVHMMKKSIRAVAVAVAAQVDLPLLCQPDFVLYCLMMLGYYICFTTTNTFISGIAIDLGFSEAQVALMLTTSYALDTPSRLVSGALFDVHALRDLHVPIMTGLGLVASLTAILLPFPTTIPGLFVLWAAYQFLFNGNQAQQVPLTVEIVGVDKAMSACGLARVFMGIGEVIGPTMGGAIKDQTGSYQTAFYIAGSSFIIGCLTFQTYDTIRRVCKKKGSAEYDPISQNSTKA